MKKEFARRLIHLADHIDKAIDENNLDKGFYSALYSVLSYMWCKNSKDLSNGKFK